MAEEREDQARTKDPVEASSTLPGPPACAPGSEATSPSEVAVSLPPFRESLYRVLALPAYKYRGVYTQDFDWTMKALERKLSRLPTMFEVIAVQIVMGGANGSIKHMHELLDRLEGAVQQRVAVSNITPERAVAMSEEQLDDALKEAGVPVDAIQ